jgi:hypothetical protein
VARQFWCVVADITGVHVGVDFESMAKWWLHGKNLMMIMLLMLLYSGVFGNQGMICVFRVCIGERWRSCMEDVPV